MIGNQVLFLSTLLKHTLEKNQKTWSEKSKLLCSGSLKTRPACEIKNFPEIFIFFPHFVTITNFGFFIGFYAIDLQRVWHDCKVDGT